VKNKLQSILFLLTILTLLSVWSCAPQPSKPIYKKNGKEYGEIRGAFFRHRWWNYYERGLSFAEGEFYRKAVEDLEAAIQQRTKDQRMARTYGMHFIDYFPHRELGIVYYYLGKYEDAKEELETSLSTVDTGRAKFYLNMARKVLIEISSADTDPPTISVASIAEGETTNKYKINLEGEVEDDTYAQDITINEDPLFIELSAKKLPFSKEIKLKKGLNEIKIETSDLLGKVTEQKVNIFADFEGPALNINNYIDGQEIAENRIVLNGALADATGITTLKINDQVLAYNKEREVEFAFTIDLKEGNNRITLAATDVVGNTTTGELNLVYVPQLARKRPFFNAFLTDTSNRQESILLAFKEGGEILDTGQNFLYTAAPSLQAESAIRLKLKDLTEKQTVYLDTMYIDGSASGTNKIKSVMINGSPLLVIPGRTIYFNQLLELKEGENKLTLEVEDVRGNAASKTISIFRKVTKVHQIGSRMSLAILPFEIKGEVSLASNIAYDNLVGSFLKQNRFNIVSRGDEFEAVLRELKLSKTDLVDQNTALKLGRLVAAEGILMGTIFETKASIEIYARFVNTETSVLMEAKDVYGQDKSISQIHYLTNGLALKFKHSFPLLEGQVIKLRGNSIYADFGEIQRIKKEMKFIVFREGEIIVHPKTGKVLGQETEELGVATVIKVFENMSMGELLTDFDPSRIQLEDMVITK